MTGSFSEFEKRKQDHIRIALDSNSQFLSADKDFDSIQLPHCPLPEINFSDVDISTEFAGQKFKSVHFVSSMTAGHLNSSEVNLKLAEAAAKAGWLMAVGSQRRELTDEKASNEWKNIRSKISNVQFLSNIGILEVISQSANQIFKIIDSLQSIGLIVHLNPLQEVFQNHQQANFSGAFEALKNLVQKSPVPVIIKEVGFGINAEWAKKFFDIGVTVVDVAGRGGTHWGYIEAARNQKQNFGLGTFEGFENWGHSTVECFRQSQKLVDQHNLWASGGIRNGVQSAKCLALGAKAVGVAQPLMKAVVGQDGDVLEVMNQFDHQLKLAIFCSGVRKWNQLRNKGV